MSFATMVSVGAFDFNGVWDYDGRLPHVAGVTGRPRGLTECWRGFLHFFNFRGFRVLLRG